MDIQEFRKVFDFIREELPAPTTKLNESELKMCYEGYLEWNELKWREGESCINDKLTPNTKVKANYAGLTITGYVKSVEGKYVMVMDKAGGLYGLYYVDNVEIVDDK